jgi:uncharacterized membrane protein YfcA
MILQEPLFWMTAAVFVVAVLYSSVGHAGASGYIAIMALFNLAPAVIKPAALLLNIAVACIGSVQFWRAGYFQWQLFWPFAVLAIPCAFLGGSVTLPTPVFRAVVGLVLCFSALRLLIKSPAETAPAPPTRPTALGVGAGLGLLAGLTGTGGGIFLTPLMMFKHWARTKNIAAVSAVFILVNSVAGLAGNFSSARTFPAIAWPLLAAAMSGGALGSYLGSQRLSPTQIKRFLAAVLGVAAGKLILT